MTRAPFRAARRMLALLAVLAFTLASGCVVVPAYRREHLTDPTMAAQVDPLEDRSLREVHTAREAAGGGDGSAAGGGCACGN